MGVAGAGAADRGRRVPIRTCVGCRRAVPQAELSRFAVVDGEVAADVGRRLPGRGAWLHEDPECRTAAERRGALGGALRRSRAR